MSWRRCRGPSRPPPPRRRAGGRDEAEGAAGGPGGVAGGRGLGVPGARRRRRAGPRSAASGRRLRRRQRRVRRAPAPGARRCRRRRLRRRRVRRGDRAKRAGGRDPAPRRAGPHPAGFQHRARSLAVHRAAATATAGAQAAVGGGAAGAAGGGGSSPQAGRGAGAARRHRGCQAQAAAFHLELSRQLRSGPPAHRGLHRWPAGVERAPGRDVGEQVHRDPDRLRVGGHRLRRFPGSAPNEIGGQALEPMPAAPEEQRKMRHSMLRLLVPALMVALVAGCAATVSYRKAESAEVAGNWDEAVLRYLDALDHDPGNIKYRAALLRAKIKASQSHFEKGKQFEKANVLDRALVEYQQATQLDPTNQYAAAQLEHVRRALVAQRENRPNDTIEKMKERTRGARPQPPLLNPRSTQPISLEFPQPVSIFQIYRALAQAFGINVLFDPNLKDQEIAIDLKDVTAQAALETLMHAAGHFYKVIDEHTILIAADTPQNRRTYEDLVIQTFFLSNAEVKDMTTILRSLIDAKKIATNDQLNAIILRDTADKVKVAEKIIETNED